MLSGGSGASGSSGGGAASASGADASGTTGGAAGTNGGASAGGMTGGDGTSGAGAGAGGGSSGGSSAGDGGASGSNGTGGSGGSSHAGSGGPPVDGCVSMCDPMATSAEVLAIFNQKSCATSGCHGGMRPSQGIDLSTAPKLESTLIGQTSGQCASKLLVAPGDPAASYLVNKLTGMGMCGGSQMPKGATPLSAAELDTVRAWISGL